MKSKWSFEITRGGLVPILTMYWKKLSHRTRTWLIFGGAVTVLMLFRLLLLKFFG